MTKVVKVNQRGTLTLPREVREKLGIIRGGQLVVDVDENGAVVLRPEDVLPVEIYSEAQIKEFQQLNESPLEGKKFRWQ